MNSYFRRFAEGTASAVGTPAAFLAAVVVIVVWGLAGPYYRYSDTWQLVVNTGTTIITFLMVFLIQNTQNRETRIVALKLDELLRAVAGARTELVRLDLMSDEELAEVQDEFRRLQKRYAPLVADDLADIDRELRTRARGRTAKQAG